MQESQSSMRLTLQWVPVVDAHGRTQLEARWSSTVITHATAHPQAA